MNTEELKEQVWDIIYDYEVIEYSRKLLKNGFVDERLREKLKEDNDRIVDGVNSIMLDKDERFYNFIIQGNKPTDWRG